MLTIILDIIVVLAAFIDNLKYFLLCSSNKKTTLNMKKFLIISIGARVVILIACLLKADIVFTIVYIIGLMATSLSYYLRKSHKLELNIFKRRRRK